MFKKGQEPQISPKGQKMIKLSTAYTDHCADVCLNDFNAGLTQQDKKCLAKCIDRASDYLKLAEKKINVPVNLKS